MGLCALVFDENVSGYGGENRICVHDGVAKRTGFCRIADTLSMIRYL
jgi:hypothetical protein